MTDLLVIETGSGGDLKLLGSDLVGVGGKENQPYLAQFSDDGTWWGNGLLLNNDPNICFSSKTETVLRSNPLTSQGRANIENAMLADLQYLIDTVEGTTISIKTTIVSDKRLDAEINISGKLFYYQWNPFTGFLKYQI